MRRVVATVVLSAVVLGACGRDSSEETARLRAEVTALQEQLATTSTSTEQTTTTTASPTTTTAAPTPTTKPAAPTTTTQPPTTTTTLRQPAGVVTWRVVASDVVGNCAYVKYHLINRSDTAVESVTIKDVDVIEERYAGFPGGTGQRWVDDPFADQTVAAGIAALGGETDVQMKWCYTLGHGLPPHITRDDITGWWPVYVDNGPGKTSATLTWKWFGYPPPDVGTTIG